VLGVFVRSSKGIGEHAVAVDNTNQLEWKGKDIEPYCLIEGKEKELFEVVIANAVGDPGAMMIHFGDAGFAHRAVMSTLRLPVAAGHAVLVLISGSHLRNGLGSYETCCEVAC
jgi:hypothetical protein